MFKLSIKIGKKWKNACRLLCVFVEKGRKEIENTYDDSCPDFYCFIHFLLHFLFVARFTNDHFERELIRMSAIRKRLNNRNKDETRDISKSANNLFEEEEEKEEEVILRRRKSAAELIKLAEAENSKNIQIEEAPVLRRRRFTRKQRKSLIIEPETGLILATGQLISSEEEVELEEKEKRADYCQKLLPNSIKKRVNGPSERKASRLLKKSQKTSSASHLDAIMLGANSNGLRNESRSLSVRDLHGQNIDFTNNDSVTKWASQILAELDSLPSSRLDLTAMTTSTISLPAIRKTSNRAEFRREDSESTTIVMQSEDEDEKEEEEEEDQEEEEEKMGEKTPEPTRNSPIIGHRELLGKLAELSRPNYLRVSSEPPGGLSSGRSGTIPLPPTAPPPPIPAKRTRFFGGGRGENGSKSVARQRLEAVFNEADRKLQTSIARMTQSVYGDLRFEQKPESSAGSRFSIPEIRTFSTSSEETMKSEQEEEERNLEKWRKKAECRTRKEKGQKEEQQEEVVEEKPSVNRVISALIRTIEDSRHTAIDRPKELSLDKSMVDYLSSHDAGTQTITNTATTTTTTTTTPFEISRSSSFDWINDATEGQLRDIRTPLQTPRTENLRNSKSTFLESSSDEADREVALIASDIKRSSDKNVFNEMDEGLALLLEYGEPSAVKYQKEVLEKTGKKMTFDSLPHNFRQNSRIVDSVYDNMNQWDKKRRVTSTGQFSPLVIPKNPINSISPKNDLTENRKNASSSSSSFALQLAERDADAACDWLKQAGFPQYVKQFEEGKFPIETSTVGRDHGFLGTDSLRALFRRIDTLNRCAIMKVDNVVMRRRMNNDYSMYSYDDNDDNVALSGNWQYQRQSQTWNRIPSSRNNNNSNNNETIYGIVGTSSVSTKPNWGQQQPQQPTYTTMNMGHLSNNKPNGHQVSRTNWYEAAETRRDPLLDNTLPTATSCSATSANSAAAAAAKLQRSQSERIRDRARAIMKKMDLRSTSRRRKDTARQSPENRKKDRIVIGDPILVSYDTATNESMRMMHSARPTQLQPQDRGRSLYPSSTTTSRSKSARRQGVVVLTPSTPPPPPLSSSDSSDAFIFHRYHHHRPTSTSSRRDTSMPPTRNWTCTSSSEYGMAPSRRERTPLDAFLYANPTANNSMMTTSSLTRPSRNGLLRHAAAYDAPPPPPPQTPPPPLPPHSSNHHPFLSNSGLLVAKTDHRSHNLVVQSDGYYMHDMPPRSRFNDSPSTSSPPPPPPSTTSHLKVDTQKCFIETGHTTDEETANTTTTTTTTTTNASTTNASTLNRRRDSGVGSSLSRSPSGPSTQRIRQSILQYSSSLLPCSNILSSTSLSSSTTSNNNNNNTTSLSSNGSWNNFKKRNASLMTTSITCSGIDETFFTDVEMARSMDSLNIIEMARLRKLAYLQITAMLEKTMGNNYKIGDIIDENGLKNYANNQTTTTTNWSVHKLMKKMKISDGKGANKDFDDGGVFGVGLDTIYRRSGFCLPRPILEILRFLRQMAPETVGIFRKNGVKSRIAELRQIADRDPSPSGDVFIDENSLDAGQVHDVADLLKQYLRDLPEPLMTVKMSEIFSNIFQFVPDVDRLTAVQYALILMPDENREAVQTLMMFLRDVAKYSQINNMTAQNLAVCFTPSLFQLSASRLDKITSTPTRRHKTIGASGMPTEKEMKETRACQQCLTMLIEYSKTIFMAPDLIDDERNMDDGDGGEQDIPALKDLGLKGPRSFLIDRVLDMIKDHGDRWKCGGWQIEQPWCGIEISSKKPIDSHPLKTYRVWIDIEAAPKLVMTRIIRERHVWDTNVINWRHLEHVHQPDTDLHQYVLNETISHPTKDVCLVRFHSAALTEIRGACAIAERSVQCGEQQMLGGLAAAVLDQRFLIEPKSGGQSRVNYIARVDLKGRTHQWYNKVYGSIMARQMQRLRDSFQTDDPLNGPETKI